MVAPVRFELTLKWFWVICLLPIGLRCQMRTVLIAKLSHKTRYNSLLRESIVQRHSLFHLTRVDRAIIRRHQPCSPKHRGVEPLNRWTRTNLQNADIGPSCFLFFYAHSELVIFFTIYQLTFYRIYFRIGATYHLALFIGSHTQGNITLKIWRYISANISRY